MTYVCQQVCLPPRPSSASSSANLSPSGVGEQVSLQTLKRSFLRSRLHLGYRCWHSHRQPAEQPLLQLVERLHLVESDWRRYYEPEGDVSVKLVWCRSGCIRRGSLSKQIDWIN